MIFSPHRQRIINIAGVVCHHREADAFVAHAIFVVSGFAEREYYAIAGGKTTVSGVVAVALGTFGIGHDGILS
jgi:hypothetical protein